VYFLNICVSIGLLAYVTIAQQQAATTATRFWFRLETSYGRMHHMYLLMEFRRVDFLYILTSMEFINKMVSKLEYNLLILSNLALTY